MGGRAGGELLSQEVDFDQRRFRSDIKLFIIAIMIIIRQQCHIIMIIVMLIGEEEKKVVRKLCGGTRHTCWLEPNAANLAPSSSYDECIHHHLRTRTHTQPHLSQMLLRLWTCQ